VPRNKDIQEVIQADEGESLIIHRVLDAFPKQEDEWLCTNIVSTRCTSHWKIYIVIINSGSYENVVALTTVEKLKLLTKDHIFRTSLLG